MKTIYYNNFDYIENNVSFVSLVQWDSVFNPNEVGKVLVIPNKVYGIIEKHYVP